MNSMKLPLRYLRLLLIAIGVIIILSVCGRIVGESNNATTEVVPAGGQLPPLIPGIPILDSLSYTRILISPEQLSVSSTFNEEYFNKANLVQPGKNGFWHVAIPREEARAWVMVDLKAEQAVAAIGILGRQDAPQLWTGYHGVLEASNDTQNWTILGLLGINTSSEQEWIYFVLPKPAAWRYYRLSINEWSFVSMARLSLFATGSLVLPQTAEKQPRQVLASREGDLSAFEIIDFSPSQLTVSSVENPAFDKENLTLPGIDGFWHVKSPRSAGTEWVLFDLETPKAVSLLRVRPRAGFPSHLWLGYSAALEASNDAENWESIAVLGINEEDLTGDWLNFLVGNLENYRYYRLKIWDRYFLSLARLELYEFSEGALK